MAWWNLRKPASGKQLDAELGFHLQKLIDGNVASGMTPEEAYRQAVLEFGGPEQVKEQLRDVYRIASLESVFSNLKSAFRFIRKSPSFSAAVVLTLALGIGANSAVFSAINAILLRPLPFPDSDRLVTISQFPQKVKQHETPVAPLRVEDWNRLTSTFQAISGYYTDDVTETSGTLPEKVTMAFVTPRFLQVWSVAPDLGRDFRPEEQRFGGPSALLMSGRYWRRRFGADPNIVGKTIRLGKTRYTIAGVMPASFLFPAHDADFWSPVPPDAPYAQDRRSTWFQVVGRLKPGVTVKQANANLAAVQAGLGKLYPASDGDLGIRVEPLKEVTVGGARRSLWILFGSVTLLLLIACTNIAALLLARAANREHEISIRYSLGASRASVIAQLLIETLVLAIAGSCVGLVLAVAAVHTFRNLARSLPRVEEIALDWRIVLYTLGCALLATLLSGIVPAWRATSRGLSASLTHSSRTQVSSRVPLQWLLVGIQVALALTLLVGAGLLFRSFQALGRVSPGFDASRVLTFHITGNYGETADMKALENRIDRTLDALRATPGVEAAAVSAGPLPGVSGHFQTGISLPGHPSRTGDRLTADARFVSQGYFAVMHIPLLAGEGCREKSPAPEAMVNRSFVDAYLAGVPAMGQRIEFKPSTGFAWPAREIRGVVGDAREAGVNQAPAPTVYVCMSNGEPSPAYLIRTRIDPAAMTETLRRKIHEIEPSRSVYAVAPLQVELSDAFGENRLRALLLSLFAMLAVSLACIGLYGTLSYFVNQRRREVGLRLALGALQREIAWRFLSQGLGVALLGCISGLCLAAAFTRLLAGMLYGVETSDAPTFAGVAALVLSVAGLASLIPAIRAARVEPMQVLREE